MHDFSLDPDHHLFDDGAFHLDAFSGNDPHHNNDNALSAQNEHHPLDMFDIVHTLQLGAIGDLVDVLHKDAQHKDDLHNNPLHKDDLQKLYLDQFDQALFGHMGSLGNVLGFLSHIDHATLEHMGPLGHILEILQPAHEESFGGSLQGVVEQYAHFLPGEVIQGIIGNPNLDIATWHMQNNLDTCAIVSQEFIIESLTGRHISEDTLKYTAELHGWYTPGGGTPMEHVGDLLEAFGIHVQREQGASLEEMAERLSQHQKVIVGVNAQDIWYRGTPNDPLASYPGIPGQQADHAVEVIGINDTRPDHPLVILNDPGNPDGRGIEIPIDIFSEAWATSGNYMVTTTYDPQAGTAISGYTPAQAQSNMLGGHYNADGTYHYDSDNTDRDPQTGAIIRRW